MNYVNHIKNNKILLVFILFDVIILFKSFIKLFNNQIILSKILEEKRNDPLKYKYF